VDVLELEPINCPVFGSRFIFLSENIRKQSDSGVLKILKKNAKYP